MNTRTFKEMLVIYSGELNLQPGTIRVRRNINDEEWQALMPFRIGYPTVEALASPRRAVEEVRV